MLQIKIVEVNNSFPTNHHVVKLYITETTDLWSFWIILLENYIFVVLLTSKYYYLLNFYKILSVDLRWSFRTVKELRDCNKIHSS